MTNEIPTREVQGNGQKKYSNVLRVKADPPDINEKDRKEAAKRLAGAIAHGLRQFGEIEVRCLGYAATFKGAKCISIASGMVAVHGLDLYCRPHFIMGDVGDKSITGISFLTVTSQMANQMQDRPAGVVSQAA